MIYSKENRVNIRYVNGDAIMNDRAYMFVMEDAACEHSDMEHQGLYDVQTTRKTWVLVAWKMKIVKRAKYGEMLLTKTWSSGNNKFFAYREYEVYAGDEVIAYALSKWVMIDIDKEKVVKLDDDIMNAFKAESHNLFYEDNSKFKECKAPTNLVFIKDEIVASHQIDYNNHLHNTYYLDIAYDALKDKLGLNLHFNDIDIAYRKEIKKDDLIKCYYSFDEVEKAHYVVMKDETSELTFAVVRLALSKQ